MTEAVRRELVAEECATWTLVQRIPRDTPNAEGLVGDAINNLRRLRLKGWAYGPLRRRWTKDAILIEQRK